MRRTTAALVAALLALAPLPAGAASKPKVVVTGQVRYADGTPAAHVHVEIARETTFGDVIGSLFVFTFSLGFAAIGCFDSETSDALALCTNNTAATLTDSKGRYRFEMSGAAVDSPDRSFTVVARVPRSARRDAGAQVEVRTHLKVGANQLPYLPLWEPRLSGPLSDLSWTSLPGEASPSYVKHYVASTGGLTLDEGALPGDPLDPELLEDTHGSFHLTAKGHRGRLGATFNSPTVPYRGTAGTPVSRGARCTATIELARGQLRLAPCWLTDAAFTTTYRGPRARHCLVDPTMSDPFTGRSQTVCEYASVRAVEIDLGRVVPVRSLLARGECSDCVVITSEDHVTWSEQHDVAYPDTRVDRWDGQPARWVKVLGPRTSLGGRLEYDTPHAKADHRTLPAAAPGDVSQLTELSVWAEAPSTPAKPSSRPGAPGVGTTAESPAHDSGGTSTATLVAAALLLLATAGAVGFAVGTRRRTGQ